MLPTDVVDELAELGLSEASRNPLGEFSAGDWWQGLLVFSGSASSAVTLIEGAASVPRIARVLYHWNQRRVSRVQETGEPPKPCSISYQTSKGRATLDLNEDHSLEEMVAWLSVNYEILAEESAHRD
jgi:hypothetical protein